MLTTSKVHKTSLMMWLKMLLFIFTKTLLTTQITHLASVKKMLFNKFYWATLSSVSRIQHAHYWIVICRR